MSDFFSKQDEAELVMDILSENKRELSSQVIREILEETLNR